MKIVNRLFFLLMLMLACGASAQEVTELRVAFDAIEEYAAKIQTEALEELRGGEVDNHRAAEFLQQANDAARIRLEVRKARQLLRQLERELKEEERVDTYGEVLDIRESPLTFHEKVCASAGEGAVNGKRYVNGRCTR